MRLFSKYVPAIALISILWSILSVLVALIVYGLLRMLEKFFKHMKWKIDMENVLLFICTSMFVLIAVWVAKFYLFGGGSAIYIKLLSVLLIIVAVIIIIRIFHNKFGIIQENITPLVWLFSSIVILSAPVLVYSTWIKGAEKITPEKSISYSSDKKDRPNILLITFDALTARDMSLYGYQRETTPFISKWAEHASVFTNAEAEGNYTYPTTFSLMTGKKQWTHRQYSMHGRRWGKTYGSLPFIMRNNGYYNMAFIQNILASVERLGMTDDFDIAPDHSSFNVPDSYMGWIDLLLHKFFGRNILLYNWFAKEDFLLHMFLSKISKDSSITTFFPEKVFNEFLYALDKHPPEPYFSWIHVNPPHDPYLPPKQYMGKFDGSPEMRTLKSQSRLTGSEVFPKGEDRNIEILRARYDEFIRYCDKQYEEFIGQLQERGALKNTIVIFSADHGESFEHEYLTHGSNHLYEQVTNIPLIIKEPGQKEGRIFHEVVTQVDITATILDLADIPIPEMMEGISLVPLIGGEKLMSHPKYSMTLHSNPVKFENISRGTIAVWEGDYKLIAYLMEGELLLFNLKEDPAELENLIDKEPQMGQHLFGLIKENIRIANEKRNKSE